MDTIVILDRIRENTKLMAGQPYETIVNESIKQTMTRSFNTLATVVITLVALLALGGASLKNFAFALLVGICSGGYHSIFFSAPLVVVFRKRQMEAAANRRRAGLATAEANASARARTDAKSPAGVPREDIVAARRERRQKAKEVRPAQAAPVRYRRKRGDATTAIAEPPDEAAHGTSEAAEIDPLDAQTSGLHEAAYEQGHEEISLNLEGFEPEETQAPEHGRPDSVEQH